MIDPYTFVRAITITLGVFWTVRGLLRMKRFTQQWEERVRPWGFQRHWVRRQVLVMAVRATVLDPGNCLLFSVLVGVWSLRRWLDV